MNNFIIPNALQIVVDDLGWMNGKDDRENGGPSRTGMPRKHCAEDYAAVNELGKTIGMKINCAFVIGEWDPDNRLGSVKCLSKYGDNWDNASHLDKEEMQKCIDAVNSSEYIDLNLHGLLHGYYADGTDNTDESDFYYRVNKELIMVSEDEIRHRLECFFDLLNYYKINKKIDSFIPPTFSYRFNEISKLLPDYGIKYVSTIFRTMVYDGEPKTIIDIEENGIITVDRNNNLIPWNAYNCDFSDLPTDVTGVFGAHWPNFLHVDPDKNSEVIEKAVDYFNKCSRSFGTVLSKGIEFCVNQSVFHKYAKISEHEGVTYIDIGGVPEEYKNNIFYVSSKEPIESFIGCVVYDYEQKDGFATYAVKPLMDTMAFDNV